MIRPRRGRVGSGTGRGGGWAAVRAQPRTRATPGSSGRRPLRVALGCDLGAGPQSPTLEAAAEGSSLEGRVLGPLL